MEVQERRGRRHFGSDGTTEDASGDRVTDGSLVCFCSSTTQRLSLDVLAQYPYVHIVVDALDECQNETRRQLCTKILDLQKGVDMRLMVTSRFVPDVEHAFRLALRLEVEASNEDVRQFVVGQIHRLPGCVQRSATLQKMVQERVVEAVGGM
jgi:hypothetical protein